MLQQSNQGEIWGTDVNVSDQAYGKISMKPSTKGAICCCHVSFYDLTGQCFYFSPAVWCGVPDVIQVKRYIYEIEIALTTWNTKGNAKAAGVFDGGFYSRSVLAKLRAICPHKEDWIEKQPEDQQLKHRYHNNWVSRVRGPRTERMFAEQVGKLHVFKKPWQFTLEEHDV